MKLLMKFGMAALAAVLCAGGVRADVDLDTGIYLYWMVGDTYAKSEGGPGEGWTFQVAKLVATTERGVRVEIGAAAGGVYAQASDPKATAPDAVSSFAGGPLKAVLPLGDSSPAIKEFYVEFYSYNASGEFDLLGYSDPTSWADVYQSITDFRHDRDPHLATGTFTPSGYNVPEPSSSLLLLVGGALLALRRRRRG